MKNLESAKNVDSTVKQEPIPKKPLSCHRTPEDRMKARVGTELPPIIWNKVKLMVLFVGYARSGHTLVGSLLDAHPHIVVSDEINVFNTWQQFSDKNKTRDNLFQTIYTNSVQIAKVGVRLMSECQPGFGSYKYNVPNQWQGRFDKTIQVYNQNIIITSTARANNYERAV